MQKAAGTETNPEAGVIVASPATIPEATPSTLGLPLLSHSAVTQPSAAAAAEKWVAAKALVAKAPALTALPALNPNHPNQSSPAPIKLSTTLWGSIGSLGNPVRLPKTIAQTSADTPELTCTTVPPAKSRSANLPPKAQ